MQCDICAEDYDNVHRLPKCLPCGHTFCLSCLTRVHLGSLTGTTIRCPTCRKSYALHSVDSIATNFAVLSAVHEEQKPRPVPKSVITCSKHQGKNAKLACMDCKIIMCVDCSIESYKSKEHADHTIEEVRDVLTPLIEEKGKVIRAIKDGKKQADEASNRKLAELTDSLQQEIDQVKRKAGDKIIQVKQWERSTIDDIEKLGQELRHQIDTQYNNTTTQLQSAEHVQEMGIFDASSVKSGYPNESFKTALRRLQSINTTLQVSADLDLTSFVDVRKKVDVPQVK